MSNVVAFPGPPRLAQVATSEPVAAWRMPSGMLLPAAAVVGAPHPDLTPVLAGDMPVAIEAPYDEDLSIPPPPGRRAAGTDVWDGRRGGARPMLASADLVIPKPPLWWRAWLESAAAHPGRHAGLFLLVALASTAVAIGAGVL